MPVTHPTPGTLDQGAPYHHVAVGTGTTQVQVAGQVGSQGAESGGLGDQVVGALRNVATGLGSAGATFADVVRLTFYVVGWQPAMMAELMEGVGRAADELGFALPLPPSSLIGVEALFDAHTLVEMAATAVR